MVKRLHIKNFQSHVDTEILFSPYVNVIKGRNMTGKSALLRALRLVFYNKPDGKDFVTWDAKNAFVEIEYDDHIIRRIKGSQNVYEIDGSIFSGFGKLIPEEIIAALGFAAIQVDRNTYELNYNHPHEAPFFISETDAVKGKLFSKLGGRVLGDLVLLDKSIHSANATLRKLNTEQQVLAEQIVTIEASLEVFNPLVAISDSLESCAKLLSETDTLKDDLTYLRSVREELLAGSTTIAFFGKLSKVDISQLSISLEAATSLQQELRYLQQVLKAYTHATNTTTYLQRLIEILKAVPAVKLLKAQQLLKELSSLTVIQTDLQVTNTTIHLQRLVEVSKAVPTIKLLKAQQLLKELSSLTVIQTDLQVNSQNIAAAKQRQKNLQEKLVATLGQYRSLLAGIKRCPLCCRPVEEHDLDIILKELVKDGASAVITEG